MKRHINLEEPACPESVQMVISPDLSVCNSIIPKIVSLNRLIILLTDPHTGKNFHIQSHK